MCKAVTLAMHALQYNLNGVLPPEGHWLGRDETLLPLSTQYMRSIRDANHPSGESAVRKVGDRRSEEVSAVR